MTFVSPWNTILVLKNVNWQSVVTAICVQIEDCLSWRCIAHMCLRCLVSSFLFVSPIILAVEMYVAADYLISSIWLYDCTHVVRNIILDLQVKLILCEKSMCCFWDCVVSGSFCGVEVWSSNALSWQIWDNVKWMSSSYLLLCTRITMHQSNIKIVTQAANRLFRLSHFACVYQRYDVRLFFPYFGMLCLFCAFFCSRVPSTSVFAAYCLHLEQAD